MTESILKSQISTNLIEESNPQKWIRWLVWKLTGATLILMAIGSATRVMNAGLACPDWPLCYGQLVPNQLLGNLQVFLEWFHRLDAGLIAITSLILVGLSLWYREYLPKWLPWASIFALGLILFQALLGGLTVTQLLRFDIVTAHLGAALLYFCTTIVIAIKLTPYKGTGNVGKLSWISSAGAILIYCQSLLGALVGSQWALHQCMSSSELCTVMNNHIIGVFPSTLAICILGWGARRTPGLHPILRKLANISVGLVIVQVILGIATFKLHLQVEPLTVAHHTVGAMTLGVLVAFTCLALQDRKCYQ